MTQSVDEEGANSVLIAPTIERWRAMGPVEREQLLVAIMEALTVPPELMSEGSPHKQAKSRALDMLTLHYGSTGRVIYLAEDLAVLYPGEKTFAPDILAVADVPQPEDDPRLAWVVADEGKGLDLVIEVLHRGDRKKDLVDNLERYAQLGIPEYFVYDRMNQRVHGYRLAAGGRRRYEPILAQRGRYLSAVLGLDLAVVGGRLCFYHGMAELFGSAELIDRLERMVADLAAKSDRTEAEARQAQTEAQQAQTEAQQAQAQQAQKQAQLADARASHAVARLQDGLLAILAARGMACSSEASERIRGEADPDRLGQWLERAATAARCDEMF